MARFASKKRFRIHYLIPVNFVFCNLLLFHTIRLKSSYLQFITILFDYLVASIDFRIGWQIHYWHGISNGFTCPFFTIVGNAINLKFIVHITSLAVFIYNSRSTYSVSSQTIIVVGFITSFYQKKQQKQIKQRIPPELVPEGLTGFLLFLHLYLFLHKYR